MNFHHVSKIRQTFAQMNNVFKATSKIEMSSTITYHGFHLQHEVHNNHLFIVIWAQPERMCSRNHSLNLFICHEFIQMGGLMTLQGSTQTLHSSKLQVEEPSTPRVQNETEKNVVQRTSLHKILISKRYQRNSKKLGHKWGFRCPSTQALVFRQHITYHRVSTLYISLQEEQ